MIIQENILFQVNDRVVALHPQHSGSYAPGSVQSIDEVLQAVSIRSVQQ